MMLETALITIFLAIFVATAIITLASLPGWIKIPDGYRKALFTALLLEVVACTVLLFRQMYIVDPDPCLPCPECQKCPDPVVPDLVLEPADGWVAINVQGHLFQPTLNGTPIGEPINDFLELARHNATYHLGKETDPNDQQQIDFVVKNSDARHLNIGKMSRQSMTQLGLFDQINPWQNEFARLRFNLVDNKWGTQDAWPKAWPITISFDGQSYTIAEKDKPDLVYFSGHSFNAKERALHFIRASDNNYYLIRISDAVLVRDTENKFVTFMAIKLVPELAAK